MAKPIPISAFGVTYPSIREAAAAFGLSASTLRNRLVAGIDIEIALIAHANKCPRLVFVGPDRHSYYDFDEGPFIKNRDLIGILRPDLFDAYWYSDPHHSYHPFINL